MTQLVPLSFLNCLFFVLSFLFHPFLRYFRHFPHSHATSSCPNRTNQPSLLIINGFKQISKGWLYQFKCHFISKIDFWFFKSLYGIFSGWLFLENYGFRSNAKYNLAKSKVISKCKNDRPWKKNLNRKSANPSPSFKKTCFGTVLPPPFLIF